MKLGKNKTKDNYCRPLLKWAGGKSQLLSQLVPHLKSFYVSGSKYIEPFFGGGAVFFAMAPQKSIIADINPELINFYKQIADSTDAVIDSLHSYSNTEECFYQTRTLNWREMPPAEAAARTLFLNKTCFNGLYRVNRRGEFNTPFGRYKNPRFIDAERLRKAGALLRQAKIICADYKFVLEQFTMPGDLIFLDPPYVPVSKYSDFNRYNKEQFSKKDHIELAAKVEKLQDLGCYIIMTNSNHPLVHKLYSSFRIEVIPSKRHISCNGSGRTGQDVIITITPKRKKTKQLTDHNSRNFYYEWAKQHSLYIGEDNEQLHFEDFVFTEHDKNAVIPLKCSKKSNLPRQVTLYPVTRFMGSKSKLLPVLWEIIRHLDFDTGVDLFSGSGIVGYLMKAAGKRVISNDYMYMSSTFSKALIENNHTILDLSEAETLLSENNLADDFVQRTFDGLYYSQEDNRLIDIIRANIKQINNPYKHATAMAALIRACMKKRARGIFTYVGQRYDDGRKDLRISLARHFLDAVEIINRAIFDNGQKNMALREDALKVTPFDSSSLIYIDPPYYSSCSDNEYVRRYHFVEGLARNWEGVSIQSHTKTRKFKSYHSLFSSRSGAKEAFDRLFTRFHKNILVVSYSSNCFPTMEEIVTMMKKHKKEVRVFPVKYKYSFGNQGNKVGNNRNNVEEYIFVGTEAK